jgi:hypothetical protein
MYTTSQWCGSAKVVSDCLKCQWFQFGLLHRDGDLPAVEIYNGSRMWYQRGTLHRDHDLPAVVWASGTQQWYQHGKLHRSFDLPAVVWADGTQEWWVHGVQQTPKDGEEICKILRWSPLRAAWVGAVVYRAPQPKLHVSGGE